LALRESISRHISRLVEGKGGEAPATALEFGVAQLEISSFKPGHSGFSLCCKLRADEVHTK